MQSFLEGTTITYLLIAVITLLVIWISILEWRLRRLYKGSDGKSLEGIIHDIKRGNSELHGHKDQIHSNLQNLDKRVRKSIQGVKTIRYNPFQDQGGNHSFSTAILDADGDGVVITGIYSREQNRVYAKPVSARQSEYELSREEVEAIREACPE